MHRNSRNHRVNKYLCIKFPCKKFLYSREVQFEFSYLVCVLKTLHMFIFSVFCNDKNFLDRENFPNYSTGIQIMNRETKRQTWKRPWQRQKRPWQRQTWKRPQGRFRTSNSQRDQTAFCIHEMYNVRSCTVWCTLKNTLAVQTLRAHDVNKLI